MTIAVAMPDMMDRSRLGAVDVTVVRDHAALAASGATLVLVDLDRCDDPSVFVIDGVRAVGYGSHVDDERLAAARELGYAEVLPRSVFFRRLPELVEHTS
ncbi:MAG: hypothetical protein ACRBI6_21000 [Acidimicrobiales bacterium]